MRNEKLATGLAVAALAISTLLLVVGGTALGIQTYTAEVPQWVTAFNNTALPIAFLADAACFTGAGIAAGPPPGQTREPFTPPEAI